MRSLGLLLSLALLAGCPKDTAVEAPVEAQPADELAKPLPMDPGVRIGTLDNGMKYFIEVNKEPKDRVVFRLAVDAGSALEDEDQLGLAHFVEHMAFNGSENFEGNELVKYLEGTGTRFGAHLNAHTSFEETVYKLTVPVSDAELFDKSFLIFKDWASGITFDGEEIEKERGVVLGEWRTRQGARGRVTDAVFPVTWGGSRYADRLPIGTEDNLKTFEHESLTRFYKDWYRPELMAFIVVGDVDPDAVEAKIKETFGGLTNPESPRERERFDVPDHEETRVVVFADPELTRTSISIYEKRDDPHVPTYRGYRDGFVESLAVSALNERFSDLSRLAEPPFMGAGIGKTRMSATEGAAYLGVSAAEGEALSAMEAALIELERAQQHGFTASELNRARANMLQSMKRAYDERETSHSRGHAEEIVRHYLTGESMPGIAEEFAMAERFLPEISVEEVNTWIKGAMTGKSRVITLTMPEKDGVEVPSEEQLLAVFDKVDAMELEAPEEDVVDGPLVAEAPAAGEIAERGTIDALGVTEWTLGNGAKVLIKTTDFKTDEISFRAVSPGGMGDVDDEVYFSAAAASTLRSLSGLGEFNASDLGKRLAGKVVSVRPYLGGSSEGVSGSANAEGLEDAFQLMHLAFTEPRFDKDALQRWKTQTIEMLENRDKDPNAVFRDQMQVLEWDNHPRRQPWTPEQVGQVDLAQAEQVWMDAYDDVSDWTFVFVGNATAEELEPLVTTYLASLPGEEGDDPFADDGARRPAKQLAAEVKEGLDQSKATYTLKFHGPFESDWERRNHFSSMTDILSVRLREELREELGGVYGVGVSGGTSERPEPHYTVSLSFVCDPVRMEELKTAALKVIDEMKSAPVAQSYVDEEKAKNARAREESLRTNGFWLNGLSSTALEGWDPLELLTYDERNDKLSAEIVQQLAKETLVLDRSIEGKLLPAPAAE